MSLFAHSGIMITRKRPRSPPPTESPEEVEQKKALRLLRVVQASHKRAAASIPVLLDVATACDGLLTRLDTNTAASASHVKTAVDAAIVAVQQSVGAFASRARAYMDAMDKRHETKEEECGDTLKTFESCLAQLSIADDVKLCDEDSMRVINQLIGGVDQLYDTSIILTTTRTPSEALHLVSTASQFDFGIDPERCIVTCGNFSRHKLGGNPVSVALFDARGEPVFGVAVSDVSITPATPAVVGWTVSPPPSITANVVHFGVKLAADCTYKGALSVAVSGARISIETMVREIAACACLCSLPHRFGSPQVTASRSVVVAAEDACRRVAYCRKSGKVTKRDAAAMMRTCAIGLSSPVVAHLLCTTIGDICHGFAAYHVANVATCVSAGGIRTVVSAMSTHARANAQVAASGCKALGCLAKFNRITADAIVSSSGGLQAILSAMNCHAGADAVQVYGCRALEDITSFASSAAKLLMRTSGAMELLETVKGAIHADRALSIMYHHQEARWSRR